MAPRFFRRARGRPAGVTTAGALAPPGFSDLTRIGVGGFSVVYRARQDALGRAVALKVLAVDLSDERAAERFRRECQAAGSLSDHPNIVTVHDAGVAPDGRPWLAMELCEQGSLGDRIRVQGPMSPEEVLRVGVKVAGALDAAHRAGVLHRDVKPENILVTRSGEPALADFGIAVVAEQRDTAFTQAFSDAHAAPEVLEGADPSPAADVYGLGSALWTLLSGRPPFEERPGEGMLAFLHRVTSSPVPALSRADVPPEMEEALGLALAKHPADRPQGAPAFAASLRTVERRLGLPMTDVIEPADDGVHPPPTGSTRAIPRAERLKADAAISPGEDAHASPFSPGAMVAMGFAVVAVIAVVALLVGRSRSAPVPSATTVTSSAPSSGAGNPGSPPTTTSLPPPTGLQAMVSSPTTVDLRWEPPALGRPAYVLTVRPAVSAGTGTVPAGQTTTTVSGLSTNTTGYCFVVSAVYALRDGTYKAVPSDPVCTNPTG